MRSSILALLGLTCAVVAAVVLILLRRDAVSNAPAVAALNAAIPQKSDSETIASASVQIDASANEATSSNLPPVENKNDAEVAHPAATPVKPLTFPSWPKPKLALVATGEQLGYFEPCGCTANQLGGMSRRASLFEKIQMLGWDVRGIDVGSVSRRTGTQAKLKFETSLEAMRELRYVALGLGPEELKFEAGYLLSQHLSDGDEPLRFLGANLTFFGTKDLGTPLSSTVT